MSLAEAFPIGARARTRRPVKVLGTGGEEVVISGTVHRVSEAAPGGPGAVYLMTDVVPVPLKGFLDHDVELIPEGE